MSRERRSKPGGSTLSGAVQGQASVPGKRTLTDGLTRRASVRAEGQDHGSTGAVQTKGDGHRAETVDVPATAAAGVAGSGATLPHLEPIQRAFGSHDVSHVEAHVGGDAAVAAQEIGATAYATGNHVAFQSSPDVHTAAHEAAHVVQQRAGVHLKGGVGEAGDAHEQHADAVADAVVAGRSAEHLLGSGGGNTHLSVQRKEDDDQRRTGVAFVDDGASCEQEDADKEHCFLTKEQRTRLASVLGDVCGSAMDNYRDAINDARIELLTSEESSWGFLAEFLFGLASGGLIGAAMKGLAALRNAARGKELDAFDIMRGEEVSETFLSRMATIPDAPISNVLNNASRGVREHLKKGAKKAAPGTAGKVAFLEMMRDRIKEVQDMLVTDAPAALDDVELAALTLSYRDADAHSTSAYRASINDMLSRFSSQRIAEVGDTKPREGTKRVVSLRANGRSRLALVEGLMNAGEENPWSYSGWGRFLNFVDDEFAGVAIDMYTAKTRGTIEQLDVTDGHPFQVESVNLTDPTRNLDTWIEATAGKAQE
jgi:hypothetical protein